MSTQGLNKIIQNEADLNVAAGWLTGFVSTYLKPSSGFVVLQLGLDRRSASLIFENDLSGTMLSVPIDSRIFDPVVAVLDAYLCTNKTFGATAAMPNARLDDLFRNLEASKNNPWIDAALKTSALLGFYQKLGSAAPEALSEFKRNSPKEFETAVASRALFYTAASETVNFWKTPKAPTDTLFFLSGDVSAYKVPPGFKTNFVVRFDPELTPASELEKFFKASSSDGDELLRSLAIGSFEKASLGTDIPTVKRAISIQNGAIPKFMIK
jgi:hypothetical protein